MKSKTRNSHEITYSVRVGKEFTRLAISHGFFYILLLLAFTFLTSCNFDNPQEPYIKPYPIIDFEPTLGAGIQAQCRHTVILQYLVFREYCETEIVWGPIPGSINYHAQARVKIEGKWYWLKSAPVYVFIAEQENFTAFYYNVPLDMALRWSGIEIPHNRALID